MKRIRAYFQRFTNQEREYQLRIFLLLTIIAVLAVALVLIADLISGENPIECATLGGMVIGAPILILVTVRKKIVQAGAGIFAVAIIFVVLPITFFFGGGLEGGSVIWFSYSYLYIGLVLTGVLRVVMVVTLTGMVVVEYLLAYFYPELIQLHSRPMWYIDSFIAVILVGFMIYIMVIFQNILVKQENEKTLAQAREIEELNKAQNRFFSSMSHEIRTPINTIIGLK